MDLEDKLLKNTKKRTPLHFSQKEFFLKRVNSVPFSELINKSPT
jgi:hypothetical protein